MQCTQTITSDLVWVGGNDRRLALFENIYPIPRGVSYNSYLLLDEKTVLLDTVDRAIHDLFFENIAAALAGRGLDYLVINHMEPDHCASIADVLLRYPNVKIVGNAKAIAMVKQFYGFDVAAQAMVVQEGDTLCTGRHTLQFYMAPMVHWPEVMVTYDATDKVLFSADAFGTFGALNGNLFADEIDFAGGWLEDARRYYTNIVGKYGPQVQALLKKAAGLDIAVLCPLHGPIWRKDIGWFLEKYQRWSQYIPEEKGVVIAFASVYGNTENAVDALALRLAQRGVKDIAMYDLSSTHPSVVLAEAFRRSHLVLASSTYNNGIFTPMETLLLDLRAHNLQNRTVALVENGSWAPAAGRLMREVLDGMKGMEILAPALTLHSALAPDQLAQLDQLADAIAASLADQA